jgi:hypothetical protein
MDLLKGKSENFMYYFWGKGSLKVTMVFIEFEIIKREFSYD